MDVPAKGNILGRECFIYFSFVLFCKCAIVIIIAAAACNRCY